jgi:TRAP-type C4-dicarboxylate transport system permease large subunit
MADTVPPSIVLIVLGSVAGVSIAGLFTAGIVVAIVLLAAAHRPRALEEPAREHGRRSPRTAECGRLTALLIAAPALVLPFLIRSAVTGGVATATEVSTIAVIYALFVGMVLYGGISWSTFYKMLVETASLTGAILIILGTALAMAWAITQAGIAQQLATAHDRPAGRLDQRSWA